METRSDTGTCCNAYTLQNYSHGAAGVGYAQDLIVNHRAMGRGMSDGLSAKAIPAGRDRWQSQGLMWVVGALVVWMGMWALRFTYNGFSDAPIASVTGVMVSVAFAIAVWKLRAATIAGALFGGLISLILTFWTILPLGWRQGTGLAPLVALFLLTFVATRSGRRRGVIESEKERRKGRNAAQVLANLSVAALSVSTLGYSLVLRGQACFGAGYYKGWVVPAMGVMCLAALVEATADTVSSEIGQAFGGQPVMVLGWKRVAPGTDGAITLLGTAAGILSGAVVAAVGMWGLRLSLTDAGVALVAGVCGLFFDSVLGATVERRGWLGNDLVNFSSTVFAAGVALGILALVR